MYLFSPVLEIFIILILWDNGHISKCHKPKSFGFGGGDT